MKYELKGIKEIILDKAGEIYYLMGKLKSLNTSYEEEITANAMFKVLEQNKNSRDKFVEFLAVSYMLEGIAENLRQRSRALDKIENAPF